MLGGWITALSFFLFPLVANAISLDQSLMQTIQSSDFIKAQEKSASLVEGDRWRRFIFKEPSFSYTNVDSSNQETWGLGLTTPFPGKSFAYIEADRLRAKAERAEVSAKKQDLAKLISDSYLDCASSRALIEIQKLALRDLDTLWRSLSAMYESGHASQAERIGAELQVRQTSADLATSTDKAETACKRWRKLMGKDDQPLDPDGVPDDLAPQTLQELGTNTADEIRGESALELAQSNDNLRWWNQAPDVTWTYARNHYLYMPGSPTGLEWTTTTGVSVTIPIFFFFSESIEAQRTRVQARLDRHNALVQSVNAHSDRIDAAKEFRRDRRRIKELREKDLSLAEALVQSTLSAYRIGKLGFAELIMSRKTLSDLRTQEVQLQVASLQARLHCLDQCESLGQIK